MNEFVERVIIERNKKVDNLILGEIKKIATENGFDTTITLNEKAIVSALKKQTPTRPTIEKSCKRLVNAFCLRCPNCKAVLQSDSPHCKYCGQSLDWNEEKTEQ